MKSLILFITIFVSHSVFAESFPPPMVDDPPPQEEPKLPSNNSGTGPANTVTGISNILGGFTNPGGGMGGGMGGGTNFGNTPDGSGDFGLKNLRLNGGLTLTSFDDTNVGSSGHFREYYLSLSGEVTDDDTVTFAVSNTRYETGSTNGILARTNGISFSWIHHLNENYGLGVFGLLNDVDIEETNGNSYSYGYGLLFTTFHNLKYFNLSSATAIAHTDFDTGYDQLFMSSLTISKPWTDNFSSYLTLTFTDSLKSDPDTDPTYGSWEIGGTYLINDNLSLSLGYIRTEFLNNYSDNTLLLNIGYHF